MSKRHIYLDNNATTPTDPRVIEAMLPYFYEKPGNPASRNHPFGWIAEEAVDYAREQIADLIHVDPKEIIFTSGATESDNLALKGVFEMYRSKGNHIVTAKTEHKAVLDSCRKIEKMGGEVTYLDVERDGRIDLDKLEAAIKPETILVSIMWANNETGVIQDMKAIGDVCKKHGVLLMSDATQAVGKIDVDPKAAGVHLMAFSSHKMYGPKGIGALYVCRKSPRVKVTAQIDGGGHERGMRSGTLNVPGIVGFGKAAKIAREEMAADAARLSKLRDKLQNALAANLEEVYVNGNQEHRMPHVTNLSFKHVEGEGLMMTFNQEIAVSSGSACTSASLEPSYVLVALGLGDDLAHSSIRFSLGRFTTEEDIDFAIDALTKGVNHMRDLSPIWEMYKEGIDLNSLVWDNPH
ncbi:MAG: IscS subfamily cysteine desulfurase [Saprospiraceae bacterium]|nr:IscS subfamily cysteine desulfurase [Candidatus Parvibacillus calidus]MBX2937163.1 IscS subfamily cysteine desulfurase [Saprospiraceae bacterium]MBX7178752.1 IscS subfamily cysteine desulfurase [Saprospiraceae bacterium]MCB0590719.1 IscS subfamily cysteine desulfurase [Saprospiraceae bacterium]MCC7149225.1 IscS subfamily cysteine desulfurase [Saprospiraceae bacterium]